MARSWLSGLYGAALLLLGCVSTSTESGAVAEHANLSGMYFFAGLNENCTTNKGLGGRPRYGGHDHPKGSLVVHDRENFLPLPLEFWADPGTALRIDQTSSTELRISLFLGDININSSSKPYFTYKVDLTDISKPTDAMQVPGRAWREVEWTMDLENGGLRYSFKSRDKGVLLVVPYSSLSEVYCLLPRVGEDALKDG